MPRKQRKVDSGLRWGEGSVQVRTTTTGEVRYVARWPEGSGIDKVWRGKTFHTEDEAEDHLRSIARRKRAGTYQPESRMTVAECVSEYMERKRGDWSPNTYSAMKVYYRRSVEPYLGTRRIVELTPHELQRWVDTLAKTGRRSKSGKVTGGMSRAGVMQARLVLSGALDDAARFGLIPSNPARLTRVSGKATEPRPVWTAAQVGTAIAACDATSPLRLYYLIAATTGMRPGEIRAIRWAAVDLERKTIRVAATITRDEQGHELVGTTTKTRSVRVVAIPDALVDALRTHRKAQVERRLAHARWHDEDMVLDRGDGRYIPQSTMQRAHERLLEATGLPVIRLHDLRHTYASLQAELGTNPRVVMETLGHVSLGMTMERYTHASIPMKAQAASAIADAILEPPDTTTSTPPDDQKATPTG
ncbi:MAG: site-specific integrase [Thermomicrobiales bacterium]